MSKHKHETLEVFSLYRKDQPTKIELVKCSDCDTAFPEIIDLLQNRAELQFDLLGGKSPVVFMDPRIEWVEEKSLVHAEDPKLHQEQLPK